MTFDPTWFQEWFSARIAQGPVVLMADVGLVLISLGLVLALIRLILGPSLPDRVVALDLIAILAAGEVAVYAVAVGQPAFLRAATILALINFLGTVAFARYLERRFIQKRAEAEWKP